MKKIYILLCFIIVLGNIFFIINKHDTISHNTSIKMNKNFIVLGAGRHLAPGEKDAYYCSKILGVWEPLITRDENGYPAPCLAQSWQMLDEGKVWIFYLRKDVVFHDGSKFNADTVIKNFDRMKKGIKRSIFYGLDINTFYPSLISYEKIDDYTVKLTFKETNLNQLYKMMDFGSAMFSPKCFSQDGNFNDIVIGTGPYKIVQNNLNKDVRLERFEQYYADKAKIKEILIRNIPNVDSRYSALKSGEICGVLDINAIPPFLATEIVKDNRYEVSTNKSTMIRFLALNGKKFPFNDVRMRQAVSLAIDRNNLVKALYLNYAVPTTNILNYTSPYYKKFMVDYNLDKAKNLAKEVLKDERYEVTYLINGQEPLQKGEAELISYWLSEIGLDVKIQSLEYATMAYLAKKGEFHIARFQQGLANGDPYGIFYSFMMPKGGRNVSECLGYENQEVSELLNKVKHINDEVERRNIYNRIQEISVIEQPVIPLYNDMNIVAYDKHLKNYRALVYGVDLSKIEWVE